MGFVDSIKSGFAHYAKFNGRARRSQYWWWTLFAIIVALIAQLLDNVLGTQWVFGLIAFLGLFLPGLAVLVRRLHDTDKTGWWILIAFIPLVGVIVLLIFVLTPGTPEANRYGEPIYT
ncbi:MAG: DUF805 domain-containing protein [Actinomycetales bacterium]|nr:DUF805 domain-containing protein [Actinomycetales bacterium]